MPFCNQCGDEITFRYVNGQCTPVHLDSSGCRSGYSISVRSKSTNSQRYRKSISSEGKQSKESINNYPYNWLYSGEVTLLTTCWWCGDEVYFHRDENGGCVLFDSLGKPWPVHACWEEHKSERKQVVTEIINKYKATLQSTRVENYTCFSNSSIEKFDAFLVGCDFSRKKIVSNDSLLLKELHLRYVVYVIRNIGYVKVLVPESTLGFLLSEPHVFMEVAKYNRGLGFVNFIRNLRCSSGKVSEEIVNILTNSEHYLECQWIHQINLSD